MDKADLGEVEREGLLRIAILLVRPSYGGAGLLKRPAESADRDEEGADRESERRC